MTPNASWDQCKALAEKHTPGPWVVAGPEAASGPGYVMTRGGTYIAKPLINNSANAHLIAAAPELLEALDLMVAVSRFTAGFSPMIRQQAEAAIAKARGQS